MSKMKVEGNLAALSGAEMGKMSRKLGTGAPKNPLTKMNKPRIMAGHMAMKGSGPMTVGGCVGGLHDKGSYGGLKAGK